jgi:hypothetical protein
MLMFVFTLLLSITVQAQDNSNSMADSGVLDADKSEKLAPVNGPKLPKDYNWLKAPKATDEAKPVDFNFLKSGGKLLPAKFVYEVTDKGTKIGPILIRPQNLNFRLKTTERQRDLILEFPGHMPDNGKLQIFQTSDNKMLWQRDFDKWDLGERLVKWNVKSKDAKKSALKKHFFRWTEQKISDELFGYLKTSKGLKFCVSYQGEGFKHSLCTGVTAFRDTTKKFETEANLKNEIAVNVNDKPERPKGIIVVGLEGDTIKFNSSLPDGSTVEIFTKPIKFEIVDAIRTPEKDLFIKARGATPYEEDVKFFEDGSWQTKIKNFRLYVSGAGEIPFYQELFINQQLPSPEEKIKISRRSFLNTYAPSTMIYGFTLPQTKISTVDGPANKYEDGFFTWNVQKLKKGEVSKPNIGVTYGSRNYQGVIDVYRGYQLEIGARMSGVAVVQTKELLLLSDIVMNYWSETFFGSKNYWWGQQRWGIKAKYLKSMTSIDLLQSFSSIHLDIAYRFTPGIWERDATFGAMFDYQNVNVNTDNVSMIGVGAFWARSMPKFFDRLFNIIPLFRYPKWVDMEFIYYFMPMDPKYVLGTNFLYNFHGKMLITPRFYIEGGGSMRQVNYGVVGASQTPLNASFLQGTIGVGYNF